jgi:2-polyprenyl-3-methyl-5-hydroxy-6-metoxy-1,4-benzoquinol methylase
VKVCLSCDQRFGEDGWRCPRCGYEPRLDEFPVFAPDLAAANDGFDVESFDALSRQEPTSFWFRSRNRLILQLLRRHFPDASSLLEIGCGTGYVLSGVQAALPQVRIAGSELYTAGLRIAAGRLPHTSLYQMDCRHIPFDSEFDVVCAFDVLEHVEEDRAALAEMFKAVHPGGGIIVSVPQHRWLWSAGDEYAHHKRRYRRRELTAKLNAAGFEIVRVTSFVTFLLPLMALSRARQRNPRTYDPASEYRAPRVVDRAMESVLDLERWLISIGTSLPAGGSLVAVARRPD